MDNIKKFKINIEIPMTYINVNVSKDKPLLIFFHGFADSASALLKRAYPEASEKYEILAINGPFPVPQRKAGIWKHAFAWYFSDFTNHTTYIHPHVAAKAVNNLLTELNLQNRKKMLIGFSQGAFFIPHLLPDLCNVEHIVTIGAYYRPDDYPSVIPASVDAIHGTRDEVIPLEKARESFQLLKSKNPKGEWTEFKDMGHTMNAESRKWLIEKIDQVFSES